MNFISFHDNRSLPPPAQHRCVFLWHAAFPAVQRIDGESQNIPEWTGIGYYIPCFQVYAQIHQERLLIIFLEYAQEFKRPF